MARNKKMGNKPWADGPREILEHAIALLQKDSDKYRRLALISVDNAVELTLKTYLGLPKRINGIQVPRKDYAEFSESFPKLLDAIEQYAPAKISGIDLGDVEWFHRLRNQLYHQGNGLTVDKDKVEVYSEIAKLLYEALFEDQIKVLADGQHDLLGEFLAAWVDFERLIRILATAHHVGTRPVAMNAINDLIRTGVFHPEEKNEIEQIRHIRNEVVHGIADHKKVVTPQIIAKLKKITDAHRLPED
jgi:hypothetical protein